MTVVTVSTLRPRWITQTGVLSVINVMKNQSKSHNTLFNLYNLDSVKCNMISDQSKSSLLIIQESIKNSQYMICLLLTVSKAFTLYLSTISSTLLFVYTR